MKSLEEIQLELSVEPLKVSIVRSGFAIIKRKDLLRNVDIFKTKIDGKFQNTFYSLEKAILSVDNKRIIQ